MIRAIAKDYEDRLRADAAEGLSYTQTAARHDLRRMQVAGMAKRLGIRFSGARASAPRPPSPSRVKKPPVPAAQCLVRPDVPIRTVAVRNDRSGRPVSCCWSGCVKPPVAVGKPYCDEHWRLR